MSSGDTGVEQQEGDVVVHGTKLSGLHQDLADGEDVEVLGFSALFTIGEFLEVPVSFVEAQAKERNLSEEYLPNKPTPKKAYTRACSRFSYNIDQDIGGRFGEYSVNTKKVETDLWVLQGEYKDEEAEEFKTTGAIGAFRYDYDSQTLRANRRTTDPELEEIWEEAASIARRKFQDMLETYVGSDLRDMVRNVIGDQYSVKLRNAGAVYFVPANQSEDLRKVAGIIDDCNTFKKAGRPKAQVGMIEVIDVEDKRQLVRGRVEAEINQEIEKVLGNAVDELEESEGLTDEIRQEIKSTLEETLEETVDVAEQYNALLRVDMKVEQMVENLKQNVRQEVEQIVDDVMEERKQESDTS